MNTVLLKIAFQVFIYDAWIYLAAMITLAIISIKRGWDPKKTKRYGFWLTAQLVFLMGIIFSLLSPWPSITFVIFMGFSILVLFLSSKVIDLQRQQMEKAFGAQYWNKPGTRGRFFPFLYLDKFKRLKQYNERLEANPGDIDAWEEKGKLLGELGEEQEALSCYAKVRELRGI